MLFLFASFNIYFSENFLFYNVIVFTVNLLFGNGSLNSGNNWHMNVYLHTKYIYFDHSSEDIH